MILGWYVLGQMVAWCGLPLTWSVLHRLEDRGYFARHAVGLLVTGFLFWVGTATGLLTNDRQGAFLALGGTLLLGALAWRGSLGKGGTRFREWFSRHWRLVVLYEALFLIVYLGWCWVRMHDPAINHTEQPMDLMLLAGVLNHAGVPPQDPWLSGYPIGYYYFGYWLQATLAQLAGSRPEVAYNLAQAWWLAMVCSGAFGVVFNLLSTTKPGSNEESPAKLDRPAVLGGLLGAFFVTGAASLDGTLRALRYLGGSSGDSGSWWWFASGRVLADTGPAASTLEGITEFPAFSFILGDNHPHLLSLPFVLLAVALALNLYRSRPRPDRATGPVEDRHVAPPLPGWTDLRRIGHRLRALLAASTSSWPWTAWLMVALTAGASLAINTWDLPLVWLLLGIPAWAAAVRAMSPGDGRSNRFLIRRAIFGATGLAAFWVVLSISTVVLFFPYLLTAQSQARGWLPNLLYPTDVWHFLLMFGGFLPAAAALLLAPREASKALVKPVVAVTGAILVGGTVMLALGTLWARSSQRGREWLEPYVLQQGAGALTLDRWLERPFVLCGLALFIAIATARIWRGGARVEGGTRVPLREADQFALLLLTIGLGAALLPELAFVHDMFSARINTVFKFYYQAWIMAALASAYAVIRFRSGAGLRTVLANVGLVLLLVSAVYPIAALGAKRADWSGEATLDGLAHLSTDERAAVEWIRRWTRSDDVILQAVGASYHSEHALASSATGRATLLGWKGHEVQWRGASYDLLADGREAATESVYRTGSASDIEQAIARFSIDYIYIGPAERQLYSLEEGRESLLASSTEPAFASGPIRIMRVAREKPPAD
jgi:YYY domain-containing protein